MSDMTREEREAAWENEFGEETQAKKRAAEEEQQREAKKKRKDAKIDALIAACTIMDIQPAIDEGRWHWLHSLPDSNQLTEYLESNLINESSHMFEGYKDPFWKLPEPYVEIAKEPEKLKLLHRCVHCKTTRVIPEGSQENQTCRFHPEDALRWPKNSRRQACSHCYPDWDSNDNFETPFPGGKGFKPPCESRPAHEWESWDEKDMFWSDEQIKYTVKQNHSELDKSKVRKAIAIDAEFIGVPNERDELQRHLNEIVTFTAVDLFTNEILINEIVYPHRMEQFAKRGRETTYVGNRVDCRKKWTGFKEDRIEKARDRGKTITLDKLQEKLFEFVSKDTIICGWGVHNDIVPLRLAHPKVFDLQPLCREPAKTPPKLKTTIRKWYRIKIQRDGKSHGSLEDALATAELIRRRCAGSDWEAKAAELQRLKRIKKNELRDKRVEKRVDEQAKKTPYLDRKIIKEGVDKEDSDSTGDERPKSGNVASNDDQSPAVKSQESEDPSLERY